jgi:hypothetical protein
MFQQKAATRRRLLAADGALIFAKACSHRLDDVLQFDSSTLRVSRPMLVVVLKD